MVEQETQITSDKTLRVFTGRDRSVREVLTSHCPGIEPRIPNLLIEAVYRRVAKVTCHTLTQRETTATELMRDYRPIEIAAALTLVADLLSGQQYDKIGLPLEYFGVIVVRMHTGKLQILGVQNPQGMPDSWKIKLYSDGATFGRGTRVFEES